MKQSQPKLSRWVASTYVENTVQQSRVDEFGGFDSGVGERKCSNQCNDRIKNSNCNVNQQVEARGERLVPQSRASGAALVERVPPHRFVNHAHDIPSYLLHVIIRTEHFWI